MISYFLLKFSLIYKYDSFYDKYYVVNIKHKWGNDFPSLAALAHISTNHFKRFFKQRTEQSLNEFINQLRIGKACKLLINTNTLISIISEQCGFNNISNFNRRFRLVKGSTPKEFRKSIKAPSPL